MSIAGRLVEYRFERRKRRTIGISIDADGLGHSHANRHSHANGYGHSHADRDRAAHAHSHGHPWPRADALLGGPAQSAGRQPAARRGGQRGWQSGLRRLPRDRTSSLGCI